MKILYDYQIFENQAFGGVSRYFFEIISRFKKEDQHQYYLPIGYSSNEYLKELNEIKIIGKSDFYSSFFWGYEFKGKHRLYQIRNKLLRRFRLKADFNRNTSIDTIKNGKFDIFHPTYYDPYFLKYLGKVPFVLTVYDMIHELYPECFPKDDLTAANKKLLCQKAEMIIAISENTKKDLIKIHGIEEKKIKVIYLGSSFNNKGNNISTIHCDPYILFVGNRTLYKNFSFYLESAAGILKKSNISLICAGGGEFTVSELKLIQDLGIQHLVKQFKINNEKLCNLYRNALAFVFPSLYEGFGIPVLEAFSCGCPCLLSTGGSIPEVGNNAAIYFNPLESDSIQLSLNNILNDAMLRKSLIEKGTERLKLFSWDKTYMETINLYESLV